MLSTILASVAIIILPVNGIIPDLGKCWTKYGGAYYAETNQVYVCYTPNEKLFEFIKWHEIGHHVWYKYMTQAQREEYTALYNRDLSKGKFYNDYSKTSAIEDFADNFAVIITKTNHNNTRLPYVRKIIKNL